MDVAAFLALIAPAQRIEGQRGNVCIEFRRRKHRSRRSNSINLAVKPWSKCPRRIRVFRVPPVGMRNFLMMPCKCA